MRSVPAGGMRRVRFAQSANGKGARSVLTRKGKAASG